MKFRYEVTIDCDYERDPERIADYICDAVASWGGQFDPEEDDLFSAYIAGVRVKRGNVLIEHRRPEDG